MGFARAVNGRLAAGDVAAGILKVEHQGAKGTFPGHLRRLRDRLISELEILLAAVNDADETLCDQQLVGSDLIRIQKVRLL
jgi:hypothetical protein